MHIIRISYWYSCYVQKIKSYILRNGVWYLWSGQVKGVSIRTANSLWKFNTPRLYLPEDSLTWASMLDRRSWMPTGSVNSVVRDTELSVTVCGIRWQTGNWRLSTVWGPEWFTTLFTVVQTTSTSSTLHV